MAKKAEKAKQAGTAADNKQNKMAKARAALNKNKVTQPSTKRDKTQEGKRNHYFNTYPCSS